MKKSRLDYVDVFRGLPVLLMISHQIFDILWIGSIYTTLPYFISFIDSTTWYPWGFIFAFVSGISVTLLVSRNKDKLGKSKTILSVIKRYGIYILFSLPLTLIMWDVGVFLRWEEVLQGLGLTAIILSIYLVFTNSWKFYHHFITIFAFATMTHFILPLVRQLSVPLTAPIYDFGNFILSLLLNLSVRGWFSILNLFPFMLGGVLFIRLIQQRTHINKLYFYSVATLAFSFILHFIGLPILHNTRSFSLVFFGIGETALFMTLIYHLYLVRNKFTNILYVLGRGAIIAYLAHFLIIIKPLELLGVANTQSHLISWLITLPLVIFLYFATRFYLKKKHIKVYLFK